MASPSESSLPWRRRSASVTSHQASEDGAGQLRIPAAPARSSTPDSKLLSSSVGSTTFREPTRSFVPGSIRDNLSPIDSAEFARSVREDTAELASYVLSDKKNKRGLPFLARNSSSSLHLFRERADSHHESEYADDAQTSGTDVIEEVSEPPSPEDPEDEIPDEGPSVLASMLRRSPPHSYQESGVPPELRPADHTAPAPAKPKFIARALSPSPSEMSRPGDNENTPLLHPRTYDSDTVDEAEEVVDLENQKPRGRHLAHGFGTFQQRVKHGLYTVAGAANPKTWDKNAILQQVVLAPLACLPSVIVGLLLNILDALSYGMILFPLGNPIFASLGPAGISIFYVSTIISQLTFSSGSIFKGSVGSELIEVVPFFHNMAATITAIVGEENPEAVIATTITSYALSSMLTGIIFYLMGHFKLGYIVGFIPRHILIGCIGGVGWFLVATGFEVSARLDEFRYDFKTGYKLIQVDTLPLWLTPLGLAVLLFVLQKKVSSKYLLPVYILCIPLVFYIFVLALPSLVQDDLRHTGWIFEAPPADEPWWYFWTLYRFDLVRWDALAETLGAMFALTFFSLLHVPINVPALAQSIGEDNADLNHELKLHGCSNFFSGMAGSIQNYLVYANTLFFMKSGGNSRLAGFMLAALTFVVLLIGPVLIGYIPVMMVGTLIFVLGFELLADALVAPRRKLKWPEYITILAIVLTMGLYDFVVGIFLGIVLAFISAIVHASRVSAIRAIYTGDKVGSMVRRNPSQHHYLQEVGKQTYIIKLSGFLFFGTIVGVEEKIRLLISDDVFAEHPIKYVIIDLWHVNGIDYTAGEGFMTISRLLNNKGVVLLISGKDGESEVGRDLRAVGLGDDGIEVRFMPDLNSALESCENEQLKTFYARQEALRQVTRSPPSNTLDVPRPDSAGQSLDMLSQSPRRSHLYAAARDVLARNDMRQASKWQTIGEPLRLMLQVFHDVSSRNEDFWYRAKPYFVRTEYQAGAVLYHRGEQANGFYLLENGELRADYETPQGRLSEPIVQGTTCGELPFFSETSRTATVLAVKDSVVWVMDTDHWEELQKADRDVAQELLRVSLKLTTERMNAMTNYISAVAN